MVGEGLAGPVAGDEHAASGEAEGAALVDEASAAKDEAALIRRSVTARKTVLVVRGIVLARRANGQGRIRRIAVSR